VVLVGSLLHAAAKLGDHFAGKDRAEKLAAKFLSGLQFGSVHATHGAADLPDAAQEIGDFDFCKGRHKLRGGLPGRRIQQANAKLLAGWLNLQIEIVVRHSHGLLSCWSFLPHEVDLEVGLARGLGNDRSRFGVHLHAEFDSHLVGRLGQ